MRTPLRSMCATLLMMVLVLPVPAPEQLAVSTHRAALRQQLAVLVTCHDGERLVKRGCRRLQLQRVELQGLHRALRSLLHSLLS